jgi:hypothetical protein
MKTGLLDPDAQERCKTELGAMRYRDDLIDRWTAARNAGVVLDLWDEIKRVQEIIDERWRGGDEVAVDFRPVV